MSSSRLTKRTTALWAAPAFLLLSGMICGPTGPYLSPEITNDPMGECSNFACPIAVGTELRIRTGANDTDLQLSRDPTRVTFLPTGIVKVISIDDGILTIGAVAEGHTEMTAVIDGQSIVQTIAAATRATSEIFAMDYRVPPSMASAGIALVTNANLRLAARHLTLEGQPVVAEGIESWSLAEESSAKLTGASGIGTLQAGPAQESLVVSAGVGDPLQLEVVSPGAVARVSLRSYRSGAAIGEEPTATLTEGATISMGKNLYSWRWHVAAKTADGAFIAGVSVNVIDFPEHLVTLDRAGRAEQIIVLKPVAIGTGVLRLRVGDRTAEFELEVTE